MNAVNFDNVGKAAQGRWPFVLESLGVSAECLRDKHGPCPSCGGKDRFRFDDKEGRGTFICNQCGPGDGFGLLERVHGWDSATCLHKVADLLNVKGNDLPPSGKPKMAKASQNKATDDARGKAAAIWAAASPDCEGHPYLTTKGIQAHGARRYQGSDPKYQGALVTPVYDATETLCNLQFIPPELGKKKLNLPGGMGGCPHSTIGEPETEPDATLYIAEGFSTAASIHEATGHPVRYCFGADNLLANAIALRQEYPDLKLVFCADDDVTKDKNPGLTKARKAAQAVGGWLAIPDFGPDRREDDTDFNDLAQHLRLEAVKRCIDAAELVSAEPTPASDELLVSDDIERQKYGEKAFFELRKDGVFYVDTEAAGMPKETWICSRLVILARTRDADNGSWGCLLEWKDTDGVSHQWTAPIRRMQCEGIEVRETLSDLGLNIAHGHKAANHLLAYLKSWKVKARVRCVDKLGWHGDTYVLPSGAIGQVEGAEPVVYQNTHNAQPKHSTAGTLEEWRDHIGKLAIGNSRLVFAISAAFAGTLCELAGENTGGFHFVGASSIGKSTSQFVAASVWGKAKDYKRSWRVTTNGLEAMAALHNDGLLVLDEIGQADPKDVGNAAYMLGNGQGKARANQTGGARSLADWLFIFLSSGEKSLSDMMALAGKKPEAGQEVRIANFKADAGAGLGAFEDLHGTPKAADFAKTLEDLSNQFYGTAGVEWLRYIVKDKANLPALIADGIRQFLTEYVPSEAGGQVLRVARRFALDAVAGELATHYGITGWQEGEASKSAGKCFTDWLEDFGGTGNKEERALLAQVKGIFEKHGSSRFEKSTGEDPNTIIRDRMGFVREEHGKRDYLVMPETFKAEVCKGYGYKWAAKVLVSHGWLEKPTAIPVRVHALGTASRFYIFTARVWDSGQDTSELSSIT